MSKIIPPKISLFSNGSIILVLSVKNFANSKVKRMSLYKDIKRMTIAANYDNIERSKITLDGQTEDGEYFLIQKLTAKTKKNFSFVFQGIHCSFNSLKLEQQESVVEALKKKAKSCISQENIVDYDILQIMMGSFMKSEDREDTHFHLMELEELEGALNEN
mgnify:CR=1 FL=1